MYDRVTVGPEHVVGLDLHVYDPSDLYLKVRGPTLTLGPRTFPRRPTLSDASTPRHRRVRFPYRRTRFMAEVTGSDVMRNPKSHEILNGRFSVSGDHVHSKLDNVKQILHFGIRVN